MSTAGCEVEAEETPQRKQLVPGPGAGQSCSGGASQPEGCREEGGSWPSGLWEAACVVYSACSVVPALPTKEGPQEKGQPWPARSGFPQTQAGRHGGGPDPGGSLEKKN